MANCKIFKRVSSIRILLFLCLLPALFSGLLRAQPTQTQDPNGFLKIEGEYLKNLYLVSFFDDTEISFRQPPEIVNLPAGKYRLYSALLETEYQGNILDNDLLEWVTVEPNQMAVLKVGAPLRPDLKVTRLGRSLMLEYVLRGQGGLEYLPPAPTPPPQFTVYKGDKKIGAGSFEYG